MSSKSGQLRYLMCDIPSGDLETKVMKATLTLDDIKSEADLALVLRIAAYSPYVRKMVFEVLKRAPLPTVDGVRFYPHQIDALAWMRQMEQHNPAGLTGGMLCLKMGLGKTLTAIAHTITSTTAGRPTLVAASKTLLGMWKAEGFEKFFGKKPRAGVTVPRVLYLHKDFCSDETFNGITPSLLYTYDVVMTTYDVIATGYKLSKAGEQNLIRGDAHSLQKDKIIEIVKRTPEDVRKTAVIPGPASLFATVWERVIADESQRFANPSTVGFKSMMGICSRHAWCLTGTPVRNYDSDIWAQMRFLGFNNPEYNTALKWKRKGGSEAFRELGLSKCVFIMGYEEAGITLPPKHITVRKLALDGMHKECYDLILQEAIKAYEMLLARTINFACMLAIFIRLRQCCIAPYLMVSRMDIKAREDPIGAVVAKSLRSKITGENMTAWIRNMRGSAGYGSPKIQEIVRVVKSMHDGERIVIFSMFTACLDLLGNVLRGEGIKYVQVDGSIPGDKREELITQFRTGEPRALLVNYKVGSEGLNLVEATHCICVEPWWTPAVMKQAVSRLWRIGQKKSVTVHSITFDNSIEERMFNICQKKQELADAYMGGGDEEELDLGGMKGAAGLNIAQLGEILGVGPH